MISRRPWAILPALVTRLAAAALLWLGLLAQGCATPCEELGQRICACQTTAGAARDACDRAVRSQVMDAGASEAEQEACYQKLKTCPDPGRDATACDQLKTAAGKQACGLAY